MTNEESKEIALKMQIKLLDKLINNFPSYHEAEKTIGINRGALWKWHKGEHLISLDKFLLIKNIVDSF